MNGRKIKNKALATSIRIKTNSLWIHFLSKYTGMKNHGICSGLFTGLNGSGKNKTAKATNDNVPEHFVREKGFQHIRTFVFRVIFHKI